MKLRTQQRRTRRQGSRFYVVLSLCGCIFLGYHVVVGIVSKHHGGGSYPGKKSMYSAGRMDALMESEGNVPWMNKTKTQEARGKPYPPNISRVAKHKHSVVRALPRASPQQQKKSPLAQKEKGTRSPRSSHYKQHFSQNESDKIRASGAQKVTQPSGAPVRGPSSSSCKIHVWDVAKSAPDLGLPACNVSDVWPFDHPGSGIDGMYRTAHYEAPHAIGHWLAQAVRSSVLYEALFDKADLILLDTHCYESWYYILQNRQSGREDGTLDPINDVSLQVSRILVERVMASTQFTRSKGKKFVLVRPTLGAPPGAMLDTCAKFKSSFLVAAERGIFCDNNRDKAFSGDSVVVPLVADVGNEEILPLERRDSLLYLGIPCPSKGTTKSPGKVLLDSISHILRREDTLKGVVVDFMEDSCKAMASSSGRASSVDKMKRARYCAILPSTDRQATVQLPLAVQLGCIPVFLGPPFHAMPMVLDVDYSRIGIFVHMVDHTKSLWALDGLALADGDLEPDERIRLNPVEVPNIVDAINHLRNIPATLAQSMHDAAVRESHKFSYHRINGGDRSAVDITMDRMCEYSHRMQEENKRKALERGSDIPNSNSLKIKKKATEV